MLGLDCSALDIMSLKYKLSGSYSKESLHFFSCIFFHFIYCDCSKLLTLRHSSSSGSSSVPHITDGSFLKDTKRLLDLLDWKQADTAGCRPDWVCGDSCEQNRKNMMLMDPVGSKFEFVLIPPVVEEGYVCGACGVVKW